MSRGRLREGKNIFAAFIDLDGSGAVDMVDAVFMARYIAQWENLDIDLEAADVDVNGSIDMVDATLLRRYLAGEELMNVVDFATGYKK